MSVESALIELKANAGRQFDPNVVEAFIGAILQNEKKAA